jgi:heme/copper-type cytochrome/quinol oxidase subunit 3
MTVLETPGMTARAGGQRGYALGWWGMVVLIATEATIFLALLASYFFLRAGSAEWPQGGIAPPDLTRISVFTVLLLGSSIPLFWAESGIEHDRVGQLRVALCISFVMGLAFLANQVLEFHDLDFAIGDNAYASIFIVTTGLHGLHVLAGLLMSAVVQLKAALGHFRSDRHLTVSVFVLYWHFVDVVWIFVFSSLYLSAHLG